MNGIERVEPACIVRSKCNKHCVGLKIAAVEGGGFKERAANTLNDTFCVEMIADLIGMGKRIDLRIPTLRNGVTKEQKFSIENVRTCHATVGNFEQLDAGNHIVAGQMNGYTVQFFVVRNPHKRILVCYGSSAIDQYTIYLHLIFACNRRAELYPRGVCPKIKANTGRGFCIAVNKVVNQRIGV